jgi:hypothetical protein
MPKTHKRCFEFINIATMTTSKALHNHLVSLSRKRAHSRKHHGVRNDVNRMVELAKVVFNSAPTSRHHYTRRLPSVDDDAAAADIQPTNSNEASKPSFEDSYYPKLRQELTQEIKQLEEKRVAVKQKQVDFWGVYKYALEKVSNLNDLRDAPDAILPGNFPEPHDSVAVAVAIQTESSNTETTKI